MKIDLNVIIKKQSDEIKKLREKINSNKVSTPLNSPYEFRRSTIQLISGYRAKSERQFLELMSLCKEYFDAKDEKIQEVEEHFKNEIKEYIRRAENERNS